MFVELRHRSTDRTRLPPVRLLTRRGALFDTAPTIHRTIEPAAPSSLRRERTRPLPAAGACRSVAAGCYSPEPAPRAAPQSPCTVRPSPDSFSAASPVPTGITRWPSDFPWSRATGTPRNFGIPRCRLSRRTLPRRHSRSPRSSGPLSQRPQTPTPQRKSAVRSAIPPNPSCPDRFATSPTQPGPSLPTHAPDAALRGTSTPAPYTPSPNLSGSPGPHSGPDRLIGSPCSSEKRNSSHR